MTDWNYIREHVIVKFEMNKKIYLILLVDNEIRFCYIQNETIITDITDKEFNLCAAIYNELIINRKESVYCGMYKIEGKSFDIFYDTKKDLYFFGKLENGHNVEPTRDEIEMLNIHYNNQSIVINGIIRKKRKPKDVNELDNLTGQLKEILDNRFNESEQTETIKQSEGQESEETDKKELIVGEIKSFRKIYRFGATILSVAIAANIIIPNLPGEIIFKGKQIEDSINSDLIQKSIRNEDTSDYNEIINTVLNNNSLSDREKQFISQVVKMLINDNKEYISVEKSIELFKALRIEYHPYYIKDASGNVMVNPDGIKTNDGSSISGEWYPDLTKIKIFQHQYARSGDEKLEKFDFDKCNKIVLTHEIMHMFQIRHIFTLISKGYELTPDTEEKLAKERSVFEDKFKEMIDNLYGNEYGNAVLGTSETVGYENYMPAMYALAEIIPTEALKQYQFDSDINHIIDALKKIDEDQNKIYELITSINSISIYEEKINEAMNLNYQDDSEENKKIYYESKQELINNFRRIRNIIAHYYEKKFGKNMNDNVEMLACFFETCYETEEENKLFREKMNISSNVPIRIIPRGYICEKYINQHKHAIVEMIFKNIGPVYLTIDNREKDGIDERF